jgi:hypothetical protein
MRWILLIVSFLALGGCADHRANLTDQAVQEQQLVRDLDGMIGNDKYSGFGP